MNDILRSIVSTGVTVLEDGSSAKVHSHAGPAHGELIRNAVAACQPRTACEVGLAFGISTLYILDAMHSCGDGLLVGMDPAQHDPTWRGGGLHNVKRAGFTESYEFHEEPSQVVLPRLAAEGRRIQFAYLDGWHTFDHTLVDFFFVDQMLDPGGIVILDDVGYPGLRRACHFIVTNRDYEVFGSVPRDGVQGWRSSVKGVVRRVLHPLTRTDLSPSATSTEIEGAVDSSAVIALRKVGSDSRSFDHFVHF